MSALYSHRYVLRGTIQFDTPFLIGAGRDDNVADAIFVADANGLPAIPGSSLTGVLRSLFRNTWGSEDENALFGFQERDEGKGSRLSVSWGALHDSRDCPVVGLVTDSKRWGDPLLTNARNPVLRDHVRINHRGASDAEEHGKFDERAVSPGHRFTFELEMIGTAQEKDLWDKLLSLLANPGLRLGGKTRRGYGAFHFVRLASRIFDLTTDFDAYAKHPVSLEESSPVLQDMPLPKIDQEEVLTLKLKPRGYWMIGGGNDLRGYADMAPFRDSAICWEGGKGEVEPNVLVVPATSLKGALSHRVAFHYNALKGIFADTLAKEGKTPLDTTGENNLAVRELFGYCKDSAQKDEEKAGQRGRVIMDDLYFSRSFERKHLQSQVIHHVGIDRFTGGARDSVLFSERPFWQGESLEITLRVLDVENMEDSQNVLLAFQRAVDDLVSGRLAFGAGSGRGLGRFEQEPGVAISWPQAIRSVLKG